MSHTELAASLFDGEGESICGVDEAGRGPLFGRLYVAAVIPPKEGFQNPNIKDSKKIKSKKKTYSKHYKLRKIPKS
jgi:ribonuclease HII